MVEKGQPWERPAAGPAEWHVTGDDATLAAAVRDRPGVRAVVLAAETPKGGVALVAAVSPDSGLKANELLAGAARAVKGGGSPNPELSM